jgi:HK97 gp10 family phage protein
MSIAVTVKVAGLVQLQKALFELPLALRGKPLNSAVLAAAKVIQAKAKSNAAAIKRTGTLEKNIIVARSRRGTRLGRSEYAVLVRRVKGRYADTRRNRRLSRVGKTYYTYGDAYYWRFIEFGTRKMRAKPLLRAAFEAEKGRALEVMKSRLAQAIALAALKHKVGK